VDRFEKRPLGGFGANQGPALACKLLPLL
jgi:hypothetical protein